MTNAVITTRRGWDAVRVMALGSDRPWDARNRAALACLALVLVAVLSLRYPGFFTTSNAFTILLNMTAIGLAALGTTFLLTSGNVDLSIGGQYALISVATALVARDTGSTVTALAFAIAAGTALGYFNGRLVRALALNPLIVTLAMAAILRGFAYVASNAEAVFGFPASLIDIGRSHVWEIPLPVIIAGVIYLIGTIVLLRTVFGLRVYAVGGNADAAELTGIKTGSVVASVYAVNGALIGIVSALTIARLGSAQPSIGLQFELDVLTAVILGGVAFNGGVGHPVGVLIGVATIGILDAGIVFAGVPDFWQQIVRGSVLLLALVGDQFASRRRERTRATAPARHASEAAPDDGIPAAVEPSSRNGQAPARGVVLAARGLRKSYGSVTAVRDVSFEVSAGEVVCLVGDNGAGKSTVIKMMSGAVQPDEGHVEIGGERRRFGNPGDARAAGLQTVYQDLALCPNLGASFNLVLGAEPTRTRGGLLALRDDAAAERLARQSLGELGIQLADLQRPVRLLSGGQRQAVAIARAASKNVRAVILDEPTAALGVKQTRNVLALVRELARRGVGVVLISHSIETIYEIADRLVVLRLGEVIYEGTPNELPEGDLVHLMAGLRPDAAGRRSDGRRVGGGAATAEEATHDA